MKKSSKRVKDSGIFGDIRRLNKTRDLSLPDWGPYSKAHFALSHITDKKKGTLFECLLIPGIAGQKKYYPAKKACFDYVPIDADADLSFYSMRCNMLDNLQADLNFYGNRDDVRLSETVFSNGSGRAINFRLDYAMGFQFIKESVKLLLKKGEHFMPAHEYDRLSIRLPRGNWDQMREGTFGSPVFIRRLALQPSFTSRKGAMAYYTWTINRSMKGIKLGVRYALSGTKSVKISIVIAGKKKVLSLRPTGDGFTFDSLRIHYTGIDDLSCGKHEVRLSIEQPAGKGELHIDGFFLLPESADIMKEKRLCRVTAEPALTRHVENDYVAITSPLAPGRVYGVMARAEPSFHVWKLSATDMQFYNITYGLVSRFGTGDTTYDKGNEHIYADLRPLTCPAGGAITVRAVIGFASSVQALRTKLKKALKDADRDKRAVIARHKRTGFTVKDERYRAGLEGVMAATLTTICFPQDFLNEYARHFTPGAYYSTLYLWDAGLQGIGLMEYSPKLALEGMNTYLCLPDECRSLILHGTVMPTQLYLYWELFQRFGNTAVLKAFYLKMRRYYRFMMGKDGSSMNRFGTGLICPWDYFYNSGGWDDYPPQAYVAKNKLGHTMSPVVNTSHSIRCAKLMGMAAKELGLAEDVREYMSDADRMMSAILKYSWDEKSGYFSYVINKDKKKLEYEPGVNFNMGMDGTSPLVAGIDDPRIWKRLIKNCKDPERMWTPFGLSAVDQSAPYFEYGGYWNGAVWVPHQWFFFKAMLDYGESGFAVKIIRAIVDAWEAAVKDGRNQTFEAIDIQTGRGCGTPYFSALSVPAVTMYKTCFEPGRLTSGFDTIVRNVKYNAKRRVLTATVSRMYRPGKTGFIGVVGKPGSYICRYGGAEKKVTADKEGCISFVMRVGEEPLPMSISPA